eukprot:TRINITY_DN14589_c0_g1_i1.p1 TRINITY_DN14589_c0_g1~~TRINITY_DN14589_c0_g1_i1.p1  ORF type:complete len:889 (+),score=175.37 TRINITY_DN14589_c0_g1_i1:305-2668(+)
MARVQEFETELQASTIICSNGRRSLQRALDLLTKQGLTVVDSWRKKKVRMEVMDSLERIKSVIEASKALDSALVNGDYPRAVEICSRHRAQIHVLKQFDCLRHLNAELQDYAKLERQMKRGLKKLCSEFDELAYDRVVHGFMNLAQLTGSQEQVGDLIAKEMEVTINEKARSIVNSFALQHVEMTEVEHMQTLEFVTLCTKVMADNLPTCLLRLCNEISKVMRSHYQVLKYHQTSKESNSPVFLQIKSKLLENRTRLGFEVQKKAAALLTGPHINKLKLDTFLKHIKLAEQFNTFCHAFDDSHNLHLQKTIETCAQSYFMTYHASRCDDIKDFLENENWLRLRICNFSPSDVPDINAVLTGRLPTTSPTISVKEMFEGPSMFDPQAPKPPPKSNKPDATATADDKPAPPPRPSKATPSAALPDNDDTNLSGLYVTNATRTVAGVFGKYVELMGHLPYIASDIFEGMKHLFEYYLYVTAEFFACAPVGNASMADTRRRLYDQLSSSLRQLLDQIALGVTQQQQRADLPCYPYPPNISKQRVFSEQYNMCGFPERVCGTESLKFLVECISQLHPQILRLLPEKHHFKVSTFMNTSVHGVHELTSFVYRVISYLLLPYERFLEAIKKTRFDLADIGERQSSYVDGLKQEFDMLKDRLETFQVLQPGDAEPIRTELFEDCIMNVFDVFVDGYARVPKCTGQGRGQMALDLQTFCQHLRSKHKRKKLPRLEYAEQYVRAYYQPLDQLMQWIPQHLEYDVKHHVALLEQGPGALLRSQARSDKRKEIEAMCAR